jgi:hypothetical protein
MTCKEIDNQLPGYEEGLLAPGEKECIDGHLAVCERCRRSLADLRHARELLRNLAEMEPPPFFEERIMSRIREEAGEKRGFLRKLFYPLHIKIPIQALATILIAVLAFHLYEQGDPELKRLAPLPLTEPAKEQAAAEPSRGSRLSEGSVPARPPTRVLPALPGKRVTAPPTEGDLGRETKTDSMPVREARRVDTIPEKSWAPETSLPEQSAKMADSKDTASGMAREGLAQRDDERVESAPGRMTLRQESDKATVSPAREGVAKSKMDNAGIAGLEGRPVPAAPAREKAGSGVLEQSTVELTVHAEDIPRAIQEIKKRLGEANARIIEQQRRGVGEFLRVEMAAARLTRLLEQLAAIGSVMIKNDLSRLTQRTVIVAITIESQP